MRRTQIYLTDREQTAVKSIARRLGKTQSEVIRTAVDRFIDRQSSASQLDLIRSAKGRPSGVNSDRRPRQATGRRSPSLVMRAASAPQ